MNLFISFFRFIGLAAILAYCILYYLHDNYWGNVPLFISLSSFVIMAILKVYWYYQLNLLKKRQKQEKHYKN